GADQDRDNRPFLSRRAQERARGRLQLHAERRPGRRSRGGDCRADPGQRVPAGMTAFTVHPHPQTGITSYLFELFGWHWALTVTSGMIIAGWERVVGSRIAMLDLDAPDWWPRDLVSCWPGKVLSVGDAV